MYLVRYPGIQPTYEELKLMVQEYSKFAMTGIQPTYEELKPGQIK